MGRFEDRQATRVGLSVRWAMDAYNGGFDLEIDEGGTTVALEFPRA